MGTLEVSKNEIKEYQKLKIISEMVLLKEHIKLFEQKYECNFKEFEVCIKQAAEDFERWNDYLEWKAYQLAHIAGAEGFIADDLDTLNFVNRLRAMDEREY